MFYEKVTLSCQAVFPMLFFPFSSPMKVLELWSQEPLNLRPKGFGTTEPYPRLPLNLNLGLTLQDFSPAEIL